MVQSGTCSVPWEGTVNGRSCVSWAEAEDQSSPGMSCWALSVSQEAGLAQVRGAVFVSTD